eukprot:2100246-Lingulodinium_polyedra.AAC.1
MSEQFAREKLLGHTCARARSIVAALRILQSARSKRRARRGGRCMECADREMRGAAAVEYI